jgi:hypothetical protein
VHRPFLLVFLCLVYLPRGSLLCSQRQSLDNIIFLSLPTAPSPPSCRPPVKMMSEPPPTRCQV